MQTPQEYSLVTEAQDFLVTEDGDVLIWWTPVPNIQQGYFLVTEAQDFLVTEDGYFVVWQPDSFAVTYGYLVLVPGV